MPQATPNKVTSWLRVKKYSWGRNPVVGVKILDIYLRCSSRYRCPRNLPEMKSAWPPWQQAGPQWRQCSQTGVYQTHRFASEHSKTGWGRHSQKLFTGEGHHSDREYLDAVRHWKRNHTGYSPILNAQQLARETKTAKKEKVILEQRLILSREPVERESQPWSKSSPKGLLVPVLRACLPSMASRLCK